MNPCLDDILTALLFIGVLFVLTYGVLYPEGYRECEDLAEEQNASFTFNSFGGCIIEE